MVKGDYTIKTLALEFLLKYLVLASWLPVAAQLPKATYARGSGGIPMQGNFDL